MASRGVKPDDVIGQDAERLQAGVLPGRAGDDGVDAAAPQVIEPVPYIIAGLAVSNDEDYRLPVPFSPAEGGTTSSSMLLARSSSASPSMVQPCGSNSGTERS